MKFRSYTYLLGALAVLLSACQKEEQAYTIGEADNAIRLSAGAYEGGSALATKAVPVDDDARHGKHLNLASDIKLRLQVIGTWTGKANGTAPHGTISSETVTQTTVATIGAETDTDSKHNEVTFGNDQVLYWDDYGTADPDNATGRADGLTIYGVAVNDNTVDAQSESIDWSAFEWSVDADQTNGWSKKDLIISNNLKSENDGTLTFDDYKEKLAGTSEFGNAGLLEFKHAMSKITIILTANKGFVNSKFVEEPTVQLHGFYQSGNVDITTGTLSNQSGHESGSPAVPTNIDTYCETASKTGQNKITRSALVFPGRELGGTEHIATVTADGNIYKITAAKIFAAMTDANGHADKKMKSGYNYILNITVDKTEVKVSATVVDWVGIEAANDTPRIDVNINYGEDGGNFGKGFSFYYSKNKAYISDSEDYYGTAKDANGIYGPDRTVNYSSPNYAFDTELYWPDHNTKYFFRGIWPIAGTESTKPKVKVFNNGTKNCQGIPVANAAYETGSYPSDLMLGIPLRVTEDATHKTEPAEGIGATEGTISLTFTYRMSQVEVRLMSSGNDNTDNIDFGTENGAEQAVVKIVNGYKDAYVLMSDGSVSLASGAAVADYQMTPKSTTLPAGMLTSEQYASIDWQDNQTLVRHDAIIPQKLDEAGSPVRFVITTGPSGNKDTYTIDVKDITVSDIDGVTQPAGTKINKWEAGKRYIYTLKITKTQMRVEATITNWIPVVAGGDFWL